MLAFAHSFFSLLLFIFRLLFLSFATSLDSATFFHYQLYFSLHEYVCLYSAFLLLLLSPSQRYILPPSLLFYSIPSLLLALSSYSKSWSFFSLLASLLATSLSLLSLPFPVLSLLDTRISTVTAPSFHALLYSLSPSSSCHDTLPRATMVLQCSFTAMFSSLSRFPNIYSHLLLAVAPR